MYVAHIAEEYWGGEGFSAYNLRTRGINLSPTRFLVWNGIGVLLIIFGIFMAHRFSFQEWLVVLFATLALANGLSHLVGSIRTGEYNPGLITGILDFVPIGGVTLFLMNRFMSRTRYWTALLVGLGIQVVVSILALRGGRL